MAAFDLLFSGMGGRNDCRHSEKEKVCKPWIFDRSVLSGVWNRSSIYGSHDGRLMAEPVFQLIGCGVLATIIEWMAGKILERLNQHKWWTIRTRNGILTDTSAYSILYYGQCSDLWLYGMEMLFF